jgi:glycosyltransferase involved in cell wall biosynthesis
MKLSIVIPIYNEETLLPRVLDRVRKLPLEKELILVDDCSQDGTWQILQQEAAKFPADTVILRHEKNQGKGASIRTGLAHVTGDIVIIQDADLEYNPEDIPAVLAPIIDGKVQVAYGSRFMGNIKKMRLPNRVANYLLAWLVSILYGQKITDEATAYKAFRTEVIKQIPLTCTRFEFCPEVTAKVLKRGYKIIETPVSFEARTFEEGKKIGWRDFIVAVYILLKYRFTD